MVITEKQNIQTQADRRHRRILERMNRMLSPRLLNRPRPELNSQSQILRSMDLVGLERDNNSMVDHPSIFHTFFQSVFDNLSPRSNPAHCANSVYEDHLDHDMPVTLSHAKRKETGKSEPDVHIIPITFLDKADDSAHRGKIASDFRPASKSKPILITDCDEDIEIDSRDVIECRDSISDKLMDKHRDSQALPVEVINCDPDTTSTNADSDVHVVDSVIIPIQTYSKKGSEIIVDDKCDEIDSDEVIECDTLSLGRKCLPKLSFPSRTNIDVNNYDSDDIVVVGSDNATRVRRNLRMMRSNKDTLVGGANKVLEDVGPDGYYKGDSLEVPPGAAYLSGQMATSNDIHSHSDEEKPVNEVPNYPIYSFLKKRLLKECRQIDHIKGDGNCFFRALSKQLYGSEQFHIVLRNLIVDIIATNKSKFSQFVDGGDVQDHVERMSQEQSWATTCEIYAAATLLQRDIFMLTPDHLNETYSWLLFKPVFQMDVQHSNIESHPCYMTLCNTNGNHYDRIVPQHGGCNCFLPHPELDGVSYNVDLTS